MADADVPTQKDLGPAAEAPLMPPSPVALEPALPAGGAVSAGIPGRTAYERTRTIVVYTLLLGIALLYFVPFLWMLSTSFKTLPETAQFNLLPKHPTLHAYRDALTTFHFARYAANSVGLAATVTCLNVFLCSLASASPAAKSSSSSCWSP
jgi:ABC-type spermidine/putrescine transport system permease subunit I